MRKAQVDDEGVKVFPEWRARLHSAGRRGLQLFRATRTDPTLQHYGCDIGLDVRDLDAIIDFAAVSGRLETSVPQCWREDAIMSRLCAGFGCSRVTIGPRNYNPSISRANRSLHFDIRRYHYSQSPYVKYARKKRHKSNLRALAAMASARADRTPEKSNEFQL